MEEIPLSLLRLEALVAIIPASVPLVDRSDTPAVFGHNPADVVPDKLMSANELWEEVVSKMLHRVFWAKKAAEITIVIH
jgi:hypothetical protein